MKTEEHGLLDKKCKVANTNRRPLSESVKSLLMQREYIKLVHSYSEYTNEDYPSSKDEFIAVLQSILIIEREIDPLRRFLYDVIRTSHNGTSREWMNLKEIMINGHTLNLIAFSKTSEDLIKLIKFLDKESYSEKVLINGLSQKTNEGWTLLHLVACYHSVDALITLMECIHEIEPQALSDALTQQTDDEWTLLQLVARNHSVDALITLMKFIHEIEPQALSGALTQQPGDGWTLLHLVAREQTSDDFIRFLEFLHENYTQSLSDALTQKAVNGWTLLHLVARYQTSDDFIRFREFLHENYTQLLSDALTQKTVNGWTLLHLVARYQTSEHELYRFTEVLHENYTRSLSYALTQKTANGWTLLHLVARYQKSDDFTRFIKFLHEKYTQSLYDLSTQKNSNSCNVLHLAAHNQTPKAFIKIIDLLSNTSSPDQDRQLLEWLKHVEDLVNQANAKFIIGIFSNEFPFGIKAVSNVSLDNIKVIKNIFDACLEHADPENEHVIQLLKKISRPESVTYQILNTKQYPNVNGVMSLFSSDYLLSRTVKKLNKYVIDDAPLIDRDPDGDLGTSIELRASKK